VIENIVDELRTVAVGVSLFPANKVPIRYGPPCGPSEGVSHATIHWNIHMKNETSKDCLETSCTDKGKKLCKIKVADVAELVDARDLKSLDGNIVRVRVPPPAP
jgi:hypothetical protein